MMYRFSIGETIKHAILILGAFVVILPFYVMLSFSLKAPSEIDRNAGGFFGTVSQMVDERCVKRAEPDRRSVEAAAKDFPDLAPSEVKAELMKPVIATCTMHPIVYNYTTAFSEAPLVRYLLNGVIVTASIFFIQVLIALPAAYALAKLRF